MARKQRRKNYTGAYVLKVKNTKKYMKVLLTKAKLQLKREFGDHFVISYVSATSSNKTNTTHLL